MNTFLSILLWMIIILVAITLIAFLLALFMKKDHYVKRSMTIRVSAQKAYDFLKLLRNQDRFNIWAKTDPNRTWEYRGTDGTVGFVIAWNGNRNVGEGEKEITKLVEGRRVETQIRFVRPMKTEANVVMEIDPISDQETRVSLINSGTMSYPMNLFIPMAEKRFPKDMDQSLVQLKEILEKE